MIDWLVFGQMKKERLDGLISRYIQIYREIDRKIYQKIREDILEMVSGFQFILENMAHFSIRF